MVEETLQQKYERWRWSHDGMEVYAYMKLAAFRLRDRGFKRYGIGALAEAARYERSLDVGPDEYGFKINNNWRSRIARELMEDDPKLKGFFKLRELTA